MKMDKKAVMKVNDILPLAIILTLAVVAFTVGGAILEGIRDDQGNANISTGYNVSTHGMDSVQTIASWFPTIALVIAAALVIGVLISSFNV